MKRPEPGEGPLMVDFDSTINDFGDKFLDAINQNFGTDFRHPEKSHWNFLTAFEGAGMTRDMEDYGWMLFHKKDFTMGLKPVPGAILALHRLVDAGYRTIVVSSRPFSHSQWIREWLDDLGLRDIEAWADPMKLDFAQEFGVTLAFDDSPEHAVKLATHCPVYLIHHPWNHDVEGYNITRVESLWCAVEDMGI